MNRAQRHWQVICLMISKRTLFCTHAIDDREEIVGIRLCTGKIFFDVLRRCIERHGEWRVTCSMLSETVKLTNKHDAENRFYEWSFVLIIYRRAAAMNWQHRQWRLTCLMRPEWSTYRINTNHDHEQIVGMKLRIDAHDDELNTVLNERYPAWWHPRERLL